MKPVSQNSSRREAYAVRLREATSTSLTPDQVHRIGLEQVAHLESEMDAVLRRLGYVQGTVTERFRHADRDLAYPEREGIRDFILAEYTRIIEDATHRATALFDLRPRGGVKVVRVPEFAERNASASYTPGARDGSRPGQFNVPLPGPTFSRLEMRATAYHEAIPGHHFQLALQQEDTAFLAFARTGSRVKEWLHLPKAGACIRRDSLLTTVGTTEIYPAI